jgi:hypothetical protein
VLSRKSKKSRKSSSSQFIAEWKNYPGRRRSIVREQSELLVTIKVFPSSTFVVYALFFKSPREEPRRILIEEKVLEAESNSGWMRNATAL